MVAFHSASAAFSQSFVEIAVNLTGQQSVEQLIIKQIARFLFFGVREGIVQLPLILRNVINRPDAFRVH